MTQREWNKKLQAALNKKGADFALTGTYGKKTEAEADKYNIEIVLTPKVAVVPPVSVGTGPKPIYPSKHPYHFRFDHLLPAPYTHIHPIDMVRYIVSRNEHEIPGPKHNPFIAHLHEHSGNLGVHSEGADYADEVPHCSSGLNFTADMTGCAKTDNALAASWSNYGNPRSGDWVEEGDIIHIKNGNQNHVTLANKRFNRKTAKTFEGVGFNQGNTIKTSNYSTASIKSVQVWKPLPGTVLAPIGILGMKAVPATGTAGESTR